MFDFFVAGVELLGERVGLFFKVVSYSFKFLLIEGSCVGFAAVLDLYYSSA